LILKHKTENTIEQYQIWRKQNNINPKEMKQNKKEDEKENKKEEVPT
jgi:hypothetical protein